MKKAAGAFVVELSIPRAIFGADAVMRVQDELARLGITRVLLIASASQADTGARLKHALGSICVALFTDVKMHVPRELVDTAYERLVANAADGLACVGGGSAVGLAKALALRKALPIVAVPTTYAGSEATPIYGITEAGVKKTGRNPVVLPKTVIYDPALTFGLTSHITVTSGLNALAHAFEALYAENTNPVIAALSVEAMRVLVRALPAAKANPHDRDARQECQYGAYLCGVALGNAAMSLHHKACHVLGGSFNLPHAEVHSVMLPYALAYNAPFAPQLARLSAIFPGEDIAVAVKAFAKKLTAPMSLREIGMHESDLNGATHLMCETPYPNPRTLDPKDIRSMLQDAYTGARPRSEFQ
ncbi:MAG: maleylacetate reductase [Burkholderiales bacterium]|nr:maleylacetate reductase [Burkholderiales bacterium]